MKRPASSPVSVSPALQTLFIILSLGTYVFTTGRLLYWVIEQWSYDPSLSSFWLVGVSTVIMPALCFAIAYLWAVRGAGRLFKSVLVASTAMLFYSLILQAVFWVRMITTTPFGYGEEVTLSVGVAGVAFVIYALVLLRLKQKGQL